MSEKEDTVDNSQEKESDEQKSPTAITGKSTITKKTDRSRDDETKLLSSRSEDVASDFSRSADGNTESPATAYQKREKWSGKITFILACIGYAVGLGNIWRFPKVAYENGGGAFLIPYFVCSLLFGMPGLFFEYCVGQYTSSGAAIAFGKFAPILSGIGWSMAVLSGLIAVYYNVIIAWVIVYIYKTIDMTIRGEGYVWSSCKNPWNTEWCESSIDNKACSDANSNLTFFYNGTCYTEVFRTTIVRTGNLSAVPAAEEFFERYILQKSDSLYDFGGIVWPVAGALLLMWILTAVSMMFGVKIMGYVSYITATVPYVLISLLFIRGVTLDGARIGIDFYLLNPDFSKLTEYTTWANALTQVCYSMSIGLGGLLSMSSYNEKHHNCFRDAIIVSLMDSFMSVFGGVACFSILGYLAKQLNVPIDQVVKQGTGLAFVVYPEAMSKMDAGWLWALLFFIMLFLLGIGSQFGLMEVTVSTVAEAFPNFFGKHPKMKATPLCCAIALAVGIVFVTKSGIYWFIMADTYFGAVGMCVCGTIEFIGIVYIYGIKNFRQDIREMFGRPVCCISKWIGPTGYWFSVNWAFVAPILGLIVTIISCQRDPLTYGSGGRTYNFPRWTNTAGWILSFAPPMMIPVLGLFNWRRIVASGRSWKELFRAQPELPSYFRILNGNVRKESCAGEGIE